MNSLVSHSALGDAEDEFSLRKAPRGDRRAPRTPNFLLRALVRLVEASAPAAEPPASPSQTAAAGAADAAALRRLGLQLRGRYGAETRGVNWHWRRGGNKSRSGCGGCSAVARDGAGADPARDSSSKEGSDLHRADENRDSRRLRKDWARVLALATNGVLKAAAAAR